MMARPFEEVAIIDSSFEVPIDGEVKVLKVNESCTITVPMCT